MFPTSFFLAIIYLFSSCRQGDEQLSTEQNQGPATGIEVEPEAEAVGCFGDGPAVSSSSGCIIGKQKE